MNQLLSWLPGATNRKKKTSKKTSLLLLDTLEDRSAPAILSLSLNPTSVLESGGAGAAIGTITRSDTPLDSALLVDLSSSDVTEATVPLSVTIEAGQASADFAIDVVDDSVADGTQTVRITAT